ncbi:hypothetical protein BGZ99_006908 [Dissophora globulifera]|uniref:Uncharacterized protein n=1 Tax=Dissophora globulifera TaxID=979702 RepID=A0A9P6RDT1_9FUNG|nr:hypothetical protein BGZ99_006908 [Dissophora globulifera]
MSKDPELDPGSQHFQSVRCPLTLQTISIPTRYDEHNQQHIVLWADVLLEFEQARYLTKNGNMVPFMAGPDFQHLIPKRIKYDPVTTLGVISKVVVQDTVVKYSVETATTPPSIPIESSVLPKSPFALAESPSECSTTTPSVNHQITPIATNVRRSSDVAFSPALSELTPQTDGDSPSVFFTESSSATYDLSRSCVMMPFGATNNQFEIGHEDNLITAERDTQLQEMLAGLSTDTISSTEGSLVLHSSASAGSYTRDASAQIQQYTRLVSPYATSKTSAQFGKVSSIIDSPDELLSPTESERLLYKAMHLHSLQMQQIMDRLTMVQNQVQAVTTQTFELHEYPIPRLFIVLPKPTRRRDKVLNPFANQFQLFFLCQCGTHTMRNGSKIPHEIHLAKHKGYDIDLPIKFFERYGTYVLAVMNLFKFGVAAAGVVSPGLSHLKMTDAIDAIQKFIKTAKQGVGSAVDEAVSNAQKKDSNANGGAGAALGLIDLEKLEALEGADLRQLEQYLSNNDKGRVLGNLNRIRTVDGHIKWVCMDHYIANYRELAVQRFRDIVVANEGSFDESYGLVQITVASSTVAKQVYDALGKARGIRHMSISLQWDVSMDDLRTLVSSLTIANVTSVSLDGNSFKGPRFDVFHQGRRYEPIMTLMSNGRIQDLLLQQFENFFQNINVSSMTSAPVLESLYIDTTCSSDDRSAAATLVKILLNCPSLSDLKITTDPKCLARIFEQIVANAHKLSSLKKLTLRDRTCSVGAGARPITITFLQGEILAVELEIPGLTMLSPVHQSLLELGHVTALGVEWISDFTETTRTSLETIIQQNPRIMRILMRCNSGHIGDISNLLLSARSTILSDPSPPTANAIQVLIQLNDRHSGRMDDALVTLDFAHGSLTPTISTDIRMRDKVLQSWLEVVFLNYGWSFRRLITKDTFNDTLAIQLDRVTSERGSKLARLALSVAQLTSVGIDGIDRVIERSDGIEEFEVVFGNLDQQDELEKAKRMLARYNSRLSALKLTGRSPHLWIAEVAKLAVDRQQLPLIEEFSLEVETESSSQEMDYSFSFSTSPAARNATSKENSSLYSRTES